MAQRTYYDVSGYFCFRLHWINSVDEGVESKIRSKKKLSTEDRRGRKSKNRTRRTHPKTTGGKEKHAKKSKQAVA